MDKYSAEYQKKWTDALLAAGWKHVDNSCQLWSDEHWLDPQGKRVECNNVPKLEELDGLL